MRLPDSCEENSSAYQVVKFFGFRTSLKSCLNGKRRIILDRKNLYRSLLIFVFLVAFVGLACEIPGLPGEGTPGIVPTEEPSEPTEPPLESTEPPVEPEPTAPPEVEPTSPPVGEIPPSDSGGGTSETMITVLFWLLVLVVVILGIALIVSLFIGRRKTPEPQPVTEPSEKTPAYAETQEEEVKPQPVPEAPGISALDNITPQVVPLYDRFVNLLQGLGPVTILPTQTRVDFQRRIIFASVRLSREEMRVQLILPHRVDDPRMVRIEVFSEDKIAHTLVVRSTDDLDSRFTTWLEESYTLGG